MFEASTYIISKSIQSNQYKEACDTLQIELFDSTVK